MEIRIYDPEMNFRGIIENQTSLLWRRRYEKVGEFELHVPITDENVRLLQMGNLISMRGAVEAGVIEYIIMEQTNFKKQITAKGRFLSSYLARRIIHGTYRASNKKVTDVMEEIVKAAVPIPLLTGYKASGSESRVTMQSSYKNVLDVVQKLSASSGVGFRIRPDFTEKTLTFESFEGVDRTYQQSIRPRVVFSEMFNNISEAKYTDNDQNFANFAYIGGSGEESDRTVVTTGDALAQGLELREIFVDAKDLQKDEGTTDEEYKATLIQRGKEKLAERSEAVAFECKTLANSNFRYKTDYDLGDIVVIRKEEWGVTNNLRITELQETYEYGSMTVEPTFGTPLPESVDWSKD